MSFSYSSKDIDLNRGFNPLPDDFYVLRVIKAEPGTTQNGDPKVTVDYVVESGEFIGREVRFHTVTFFRDKTNRGANISIHFLKTIGEPFEGDFDVHPERWLGKLLRARVASQTRNGKTFPAVKFVTPLEPDTKLEEIPF